MCCAVNKSVLTWSLSVSNNGSRDIVTPKMICNHSIISRNEKNRSKLVNCKVLVHCVIYSGHGRIFKSLNLIEFI